AFNIASATKKSHCLLRDERGASALEFAMIAAPLIFLLLAVMQIGYVYFANFALDGAVANGARLIRTGQAQTQGFDAAKFKEELCKGLVGPLSCGKLLLDVRSYDNFGAAAAGLTPPFDDQGNVNNNTAFQPGGSEQVVIVRAFYRLELASLFPSAFGLDALSNTGDGDRLLVSTSAFRNEPY
ncbi:MAG: TadE/TadG family type IV pilus assembly protein, partial [Pseudomonadota bacterium]